MREERKKGKERMGKEIHPSTEVGRRSLQQLLAF